VSDLSGTPLYLAPELYAGQPASPASDLYSLGVLLFYLVSRTYPVEGRNLTEIMLRHKSGERTLLSDLRPDLPGRFVQVVQRALAPAPDERPRSAGAMMAELMEAMPGAARQHSGIPVPVSTAGPAVNDARGLSLAASVRRLPLPLLGLFVLAGAVSTVLVLGFLTTVHYDRAIGRSSEFSTEGIGTWLLYGFRFLVGPTVYVILLWLILHVLETPWHFVQRLSPPVRRLADHARSSISGTFGRIAGWDGASRAHLLLLMQVLTLGLTLWVYQRLLELLPATLDEVDASSLTVLAPLADNWLPVTYTAVISVLVAVAARGWIALFRNKVLWATVPRTSVAAAVALMVLMVLLIAVPDRLFFKGVGEVVSYQGQRCFITGQRHDDRLLYCPDRPKFERTPIAKSGDLRPEPGDVRIFSRPNVPQQ
jgi:hypothetical protein